MFDLAAIMEDTYLHLSQGALQRFANHQPVNNGL